MVRYNTLDVNRKWGYFSSILANVWWFLRWKQTIMENVIVPINYGPSFIEFSQTPYVRVKEVFLMLLMMLEQNYL